MNNLLKKLGEGKSCKGCNGCTCDSEILIGDVLEKMQGKYYGDGNIENSDLCYKWGKCGFTRSLQEILSDMEECMTCKTEEYKVVHFNCINSPYKKQLKPEAQTLINFLEEIL